MSEYFNILFISEDYVKNYSPLMQNVDPQMIRMQMFESQNIDLNYIIGDDLYDEILDQYEDYKDAIATGFTGSSTTYVTQDNQDLIKKAKPFLLYSTLKNSAYSLATKLTNKGITEQSSDYSSNVDYQVMNTLKKDWKNKADNYGKLLIKYINDNIDSYPLYSDDDSCDGGASKIFTNSLYLGKNI